MFKNMKKFLTKCLMSVLMLVMVISPAACGQKDDGISDGSVGNNNEISQNTNNNNEAVQNTQIDFTSNPKLVKTLSNVDSVLSQREKFFTVRLSGETKYQYLFDINGNDVVSEKTFTDNNAYIGIFNLKGSIYDVIPIYTKENTLFVQDDKLIGELTGSYSVGQANQIPSLNMMIINYVKDDATEKMIAYDWVQKKVIYEIKGYGFNFAHEKNNSKTTNLLDEHIIIVSDLENKKSQVRKTKTGEILKEGDLNQFTSCGDGYFLERVYDTVNTYRVAAVNIYDEKAQLVSTRTLEKDEKILDPVPHIGGIYITYDYIRQRTDIYDKDSKLLKTYNDTGFSGVPGSSDDPLYDNVHDIQSYSLKISVAIHKNGEIFETTKAGAIRRYTKSLLSNFIGIEGDNSNQMYLYNFSTKQTFSNNKGGEYVYTQEVTQDGKYAILTFNFGESEYAICDESFNIIYNSAESARIEFINDEYAIEYANEKTEMSIIKLSTGEKKKLNVEGKYETHNAVGFVTKDDNNVYRVYKF